MRLLGLISLLALGCNSSVLGGVGAPCHSSEDCAAGLVCDFAKKVHVCAGTLTRPPDLSTGSATDGPQGD